MRVKLFSIKSLLTGWAVGLVFGGVVFLCDGLVFAVAVGAFSLFVVIVWSYVMRRVDAKREENEAKTRVIVGELYKCIIGFLEVAIGAEDEKERKKSIRGAVTNIKNLMNIFQEGRTHVALGINVGHLEGCLVRYSEIEVGKVLHFFKTMIQVFELD